jgi:hypothetical protein
MARGVGCGEQAVEEEARVTESTPPDIQRLAECCERRLPLKDAALGGEYGYRCLPLCVIDAVWSIGVRYAGAKNVVDRYTDFFTRRYPDDREHSIEEFLNAINEQGAEQFASSVFRNRQRTSSRNGILKAEAVVRFGCALHAGSINYIADVPKVAWYEDLPKILDQPFAREIVKIPGQGSGISMSYFLMLSGSEGLAKPDRMVLGFIATCIGREVDPHEALALVSHASRLLKERYSKMTPRALDHEIWKYQSGKKP